MTRRFLFATAALAGAVFVVGAPLARADSVWPQTPASNNNSLYNDRKASQVGDVVTIVVNESVTGTNQSQTQTQKTSSTSGQAGLAFWFGPQMPISSWGVGAQEGLDGSGLQTQSGQLQTQIAARVGEILPDGNLRIHAHKLVLINDERQLIELTGVIRPQDIGGDNTVPSSAIADAQITYEGKGPISEKARPGILTRVFDWLMLI